MRALIQRVSSASVTVDNTLISEIDAGLLILVCAMPGDGTETCTRLAAKIAKMRIFQDDAGKMNRALLDTGGQALVVSQFTLAADTSRGNRPGFSNAAAPDDANHLYLTFAESLRGLGPVVKTGRFGADMQVALTNDGPVTIWLDTATG